MVNLFVLLFYISFIESYRLLAVTAVIAMVYAVVVCGQKNVIHLIKPVLPFVILMLLPLTLNDFHFTLMIMMKVMLSSVLLGTVIAKHSALHLVDYMTNMGFPPVFNRILSLTFRYFHMIYEDVKVGRKALNSRGIQERMGLSVIKILGEWMGGFFLKSVHHSDRVYHAMKSRGYEGETKNNPFSQRKILVHSGLLILFLAAVLVIDRKV